MTRSGGKNRIANTSDSAPNEWTIPLRVRVRFLFVWTIFAHLVSGDGNYRTAPRCSATCPGTGSGRDDFVVGCHRVNARASRAALHVADDDRRHRGRRRSAVPRGRHRSAQCALGPRALCSFARFSVRKGDGDTRTHTSLSPCTKLYTHTHLNHLLIHVVRIWLFRSRVYESAV